MVLTRLLFVFRIMANCLYERIDRTFENTAFIKVNTVSTIFLFKYSKELTSVIRSGKDQNSGNPKW